MTLLPAPATFIILKDFNGHPYMNDWVDINVLFGMAGVAFGTGPQHPGIIYPEIYLPMKQQLLVDVDHVTGNGRTVESLMISFIGAKVFKGAA
jgi:hypothetical protein